MRRREFLATLAGGALAATLPGRVARAATATKRPRYFVYFFLPGGIDSLYSFDPKIDGEASERVWLPYKKKDVVEASALRLAPYAASLAPYANRIAVINGVATATVAHEMGEVQSHFMSRDELDVQSPSFTAQIGAHLAPDSPLHEVRFGRSGFLTLRHRPGGRSLSFVDTLTIDQFRDLSTSNPKQFDDALEQLDRNQRTSSEPRVRECVAATMHLMKATRDKPKPRPMDSNLAAALDAELLRQTSPQFRKALEASPEGLRTTFEHIAWLLEHDITPTVWTDTSVQLDSHVQNHELQVNGVAVLMQCVAEFLAHLAKIPSVRGVPLSDEVAILICSELGRFPFLNNFSRGKDHFPHAPMVLIGNGIRPGMYGETDKDMVGLPVSLSTGRPGSGATPMMIDDMGASVRQWFGAPQPAWLSGRPFDFLFA